MILWASLHKFDLEKSKNPRLNHNKIFGRFTCCSWIFHPNCTKRHQTVTMWCPHHLRDVPSRGTSRARSSFAAYPGRRSSNFTSSKKHMSDWTSKRWRNVAIKAIETSPKDFFWAKSPWKGRSNQKLIAREAQTAVWRRSVLNQVQIHRLRVKFPKILQWFKRFQISVQTASPGIFSWKPDAWQIRAEFFPDQLATPGKTSAYAVISWFSTGYSSLG